jgi:hypothetical protein
MTIRDGAGKIRQVWGGYSPKIHDGQFVELFRSEFETSFKVFLLYVQATGHGRLIVPQGSGIIGDEHFRKASKLFSDPVVYAPFKKPRRGILSASQAAWNEDLRKLRARVETPYGWIKRKFEALSKPWMEPLWQLDHAVMLAFAIWNVRGAKQPR